jgi:hypothetical protein
MAWHVPYTRHTFRPVNDILPGNEHADHPVEFDIVPAWGGDLARIKSIVFASTGLIQERVWSPDVQEAVIKAFDTGGPAFIDTVTAVRGLTIPSIMAVRAGLILDPPTKVLENGQTVPDHDAPHAILNGLAFSRICGALPAMALHVASEIAKISDKAEQAMDPRFFKQPSGSSSAATGAKGRGSNATTARRTSRRRGTAASGSVPTDSPT